MTATRIPLMIALAAMLLPAKALARSPALEVMKTASIGSFLSRVTAGEATTLAKTDKQSEKELVDPRLTARVTLAVKGMALSDLCDQLRANTGVRLEAGRSVADEKMTVLCERVPLREIMRQLGRPFGYTWLRSGKEGEYRYELVQDLRSRLMEEDLRNRDRNAALLALEREVERYHPYLGLSPDEALARAKTAAPGEKVMLERLAGDGWGPLQIYARLSREEFATLRAGQSLTFAQESRPGEQPLPAQVARGVLQSLRDRRVVMTAGGGSVITGPNNSNGRPLTDIPEARAVVSLSFDRSDLGRLQFRGSSGARIRLPNHDNAFSNGHSLAEAVSPTVANPQNAIANAKLARDPALQRRAAVRPAATPSASRIPRPEPNEVPLSAVSPTRDAGYQTEDPKVTSADVLEALHRATGIPIVADCYTHLYAPAVVGVADQPLFEALNQLADTMHLRWSKDGAWLQFRSASYYDDRLKEVPNRLLARWAASRQEHGTLTLEDLVEIAQLSDPQLRAREMAEGAKVLWGLEEWGLAPAGEPLRHLRFLGSFTPAQREEALTAAGLPFARMSLVQQQQFIALVAGPRADALKSLEELLGATLRVEYTVPGGFEWRRPDESGRRSVAFSSARERTREAALQAALRLDAHAEPAQIVPTELAVTFRYVMGSPNTGYFTRLMRATPSGSSSSTGRTSPDNAPPAVPP